MSLSADLSEMSLMETNKTTNAWSVKMGRNGVGVGVQC